MKLFQPAKFRKVNFLIIGTQKGGTSALDHYLRQHPDVGMPGKKELHFFDNEKKFSKGRTDYKFYESRFRLLGKKRVFGEATPIYMYWEPAIRRIWEYNPEIKLIAILRNPAERAFSQWNMETSRKWEKKDFMFCIRNETERSRKALPLQHRVYSYIDRGYYSEQIRRLYRYFPKEQLLFVKYDDFVSSQEATLKSIFRFLGIDSAAFRFDPREVHQRPYLRKMTLEERLFLREIYLNDIREVERLLGWDCSEWIPKNVPAKDQAIILPQFTDSSLLAMPGVRRFAMK